MKPTFLPTSADLRKWLERQSREAFFRAQAPYYQRTASRWVMSAQKEETRLRRLARLIEDSAKGRRIGALEPQRGPKGAKR
jgi:hypothetical protein